MTCRIRIGSLNHYEVTSFALLDALLELEQLRAVKRAYATLDPTARRVQVRGVG